jgi:membrane-bound ClpP family serine protease
VLFGVGAVLCVAEYFLPTGGFLIVLGVLVCFGGAGVVAAFGSTAELVAALVLLGVGAPIVMYGMFQWWGKAAGLRADPDPEPAQALPGLSETQLLVGRFGKALTPLRPAGAVEFDGRRHDAVSEGPMLDANTYVKCVAVRAGVAVVRAVPASTDFAELDLDDLK